MKGDGGVMTCSTTIGARHAFASAMASRSAGAESLEKSVGWRMRRNAAIALLEGRQVGSERARVELAHLDLQHVGSRLLRLGLAKPPAQIALGIFRAHAREIVRDGCAGLADRVAAIAALLGEEALPLGDEGGVVLAARQSRRQGERRH